MAKTTRREIELNPRFPVPPTVIDVRHENQEDSYIYYEGDQDIIVDVEDGPILETPDSAIPSAPSRFTIVSQTIRIGDDGRATVDVLLEFPDTGVNVDAKVTPA